MTAEFRPTLAAPASPAAALADTERAERRHRSTLRAQGNAAMPSPRLDLPSQARPGRAAPCSRRWTDRVAATAPLEFMEQQRFLLTNPGFGGDLKVAARIAASIYKPGVAAETHRHAPNASRAILSDSGGYTMVERERRAVRRGDRTPADARHGDDPETPADRHARLAAARISRRHPAGGRRRNPAERQPVETALRSGRPADALVRPRSFADVPPHAYVRAALDGARDVAGISGDSGDGGFFRPGDRQLFLQDAWPSGNAVGRNRRRNPLDRRRPPRRNRRKGPRGDRWRESGVERKRPLRGTRPRLAPIRERNRRRNRVRRSSPARRAWALSSTGLRADGRTAALES